MLGIKKTMLCVGGLMVAAGGPVTMFTASDLAGGVKQSWFAATATAPGSPSQTAPESDPTSAQSADAANPALAEPLSPAGPSASEGFPTPSLAEVLRFDVSVEWILQRWPRVSTGLPYLQMQGYRVPLVTGTSLTDLAGSLTYYFNAHQQAVRIAFRGTTGDPRVLVGLLTSRHHFARRLTNDPGVVMFEAVDASNQPIGSLKIRSAQVIKVDQPYSRFEIDLAMDRPD
jgi:hypothetical protein